MCSGSGSGRSFVDDGVDGEGSANSKYNNYK